MNEIKFFINNEGTMQLSQEKPDGDVILHIFHNFSDFSETGNDIKISASDLVMLMNLYRYIKENDIQNDFINPNGKNKE